MISKHIFTTNCDIVTDTADILIEPDKNTIHFILSEDIEDGLIYLQTNDQLYIVQIDELKDIIETIDRLTTIE